MFKRPIYALLLRRLREPRRFLQVLAGPRQVGKTTLAKLAFPRAMYQDLQEPMQKALFSADAAHQLELVESKPLILDEAQNIKNPSTKQAQAARSLQADPEGPVGFTNGPQQRGFP